MVAIVRIDPAPIVAPSETTLDLPVRRSDPAVALRLPVRPHRPPLDARPGNLPPPATPRGTRLSAERMPEPAAEVIISAAEAAALRRLLAGGAIMPLRSEAMADVEDEHVEDMDATVAEAATLAPASDEIEIVPIRIALLEDTPPTEGARQ